MYNFLFFLNLNFVRYNYIITDFQRKKKKKKNYNLNKTDIYDWGLLIGELEVRIFLSELFFLAKIFHLFWEILSRDGTAPWIQETTYY